MSSFYRSTVQEFLSKSAESILSKLSLAYANRGYTSQYSDQTLTWEHDIRSLHDCLSECTHRSDAANAWGIILEFSIPRKEQRVDVILLVGDAIVVVESKAGSATAEAKRQVEQYALLLHYFHKASADRRIVPVVISTDEVETGLAILQRKEQFSQLATYWIAPVSRTSWTNFPTVLLEIGANAKDQADIEFWDSSPYFPVPSIIEAAVALKSGLAIPDIAHSEASEHEIETVRHTIQSYVDLARSESQHLICFLTGVPGSGKTLVGLSLAHASENQSDAVHFMSGNGPLVKVLQHLFKTESMRRGKPSPQAEAESKTLIENVHVFARYHTEDNSGPPSNHAVIFDEAQRAWNRAQNLKKFKRDYSEPEMLLRIMERHSDWAVVIALVGGGQEINDGEAGLEEWGRALVGSAANWLVYASPEVIEGGASTAGHRLFDGVDSQNKIRTSPKLHLRTSNRSLRAENLATWVNSVIDGDSEGAAALDITRRFPIFITRDLGLARQRLQEQGIGANRFGLAGSSKATRLRAEGLEPSSSFHAEYPWEHWYLGGRADIRSSYRCEVFATEFEIQGLELDWVGLCWGGDFIWDNSGAWQLRELRLSANSKWNVIRRPDKREYRKNAYRVLLTRARQGMILFVPRGNGLDSTNLPSDFDSTFEFLKKCGAIPI